MNAAVKPAPERVASYYTATLNEETDYPSLQGQVSVDIAIIGGGFTGVATAVEQRIGHGRRDPETRNYGQTVRLARKHRSVIRMDAGLRPRRGGRAVSRRKYHPLGVVDPALRRVRFRAARVGATERLARL